MSSSSPVVFRGIGERELYAKCPCLVNYTQTWEALFYLAICGHTYHGATRRLCRVLSWLDDKAGAPATPIKLNCYRWYLKKRPAEKILRRLLWEATTQTLRPAQKPP